MPPTPDSSPEPPHPQPLSLQGRGEQDERSPHSRGRERGLGGEGIQVARRARAGAYLAIREGLTLAAVLVVVVGVAAAFIWPWLPRPPIGGEHLATYAPLRDGDARVLLRSAGDGEVQGWLAQNTRLIPGLRVATDLRKTIADGFLAVLKRPGEASIPEGELNSRLAALAIVETRTYELDTDGKVVETWQYFARDDRGDLLIGIHYPQLDRDVIVDPAILILPGTPQVGETMRSEGMFGSGTHTWDVRLLTVGPYDGAAGRFDDCLQYESVVVVTVPAETTRSLSRDWYCAEIGWVEGQQLDEDGTLKQRTVWLGANDGQADEMPLPPAQPTLSEVPTPAEPERWRLSRLGRARATGETSETTILPTWLPTDPPLLLAAGFASDLVAFDTFTPGAPPRWRFHTSGTVYGQPAFDPTAGRVYLGSSDKRLYALDTRGLFLWSFEMADNVAARPLVVGDLVVAAGEGGTVYGLGAATGRERWTFEAGDGVVSWPALADGVIVVGSDGGTVFGIDPAAGTERWRLSVGAAVEAPVVVDDDDGMAYVASRDGSLAAFKPSDCTAESCETEWSVEPGGTLRTAPLVAAHRVIVVDDEGAVIALSKEDGKRLWALGGPRYVGAPVLVGESIVAATARGSVERISLDGKRLDRWDASTVTNPADGEPAFSYGPVLGGDSIWLGDSSAVIRRLGAPPIGQIPAISMAWVDQSTRPPFTASQLRSSVAEHEGQAIVVDFDRSVFVLDPETGAGSKLVDLPGDGVLSQVDPTAVGDTLLTISARMMQALDLRTGQVRWQGTVPGTTVRPPVLAGEAVLWANTAEGQGSLLALDLANGTLRWNASLGPVAQVGGVVASGDRAFTSTPPAAWNTQTGAQQWQTPVQGVTLGGPALAPDGRTVYVGGIDDAGEGGMVVALDAATGAVRWRTDFEDAVMAPLDQLWAQDDLVVMPDLSGKVIVLDAETGAERWRFEPPVDRLGNVTVARGRVWFMLENARLYGLDLATGRPTARLTELELSLNGQGLTQRPMFVGDRLIFPAGLILLGLEPPEGEP